MLDIRLILSIDNFKVLKQFNTDYSIIEIESLNKVKCIHCKSFNLRKKDKFIRKVKHISIGRKLTKLHIHSYKYHCRDCNRYFNQRFDGILPYKRATEPFRKEIVTSHNDGLCQKTISKNKRLSCSTVERWYQEFMHLANQKIKNAQCPKIIGIDEHFFSKKKGYATTIADLTKNRVYDVALGRSEKALEPYLNKLKGKDRVELVCMDLSITYRSIIKKHFKNAQIIADRFHVIRLINHHFMQTWKTLDERGKWNRGLLSLMRRHEWNLKEEQKTKLKAYLKKIPGLEPIYDFKQKLNKLMLIKHRTESQCKKLIPKFIKMIEQLKESGFQSMQRLGNTMQLWNEEIVRMWRYTKSNGITEGLHNKMEVLSRRAYGFRNFNNYRLRVRVTCGYGL